MNENNKFPLISGYLSLDLVNTELVRRGQREDLLLSKRDVLDWLHVMNKGNSFFCDKLLFEFEESTDQIFESILEVRNVLRANYELVAGGQAIPNQFIAFLEKKIEAAPFTYKLMNQKLVVIPVGEVKDILVSLIAFDAISLIAENKLDYLKRCANLDCVLLFIDESGRRKWCSMKICGNRNKVARFHRGS
ncbi:CGNR zinc finger domain-containing protein [Bacillus solitudinis]|uniref:CGNR zinc finger domain-containing protein n=1 Tax=Bacillus solitudinis TaxID=2014074 RepID=UPI000C23C475|nr:CGNR zinc finger domain-containing protein [Bacillus solitudinis]